MIGAQLYDRSRQPLYMQAASQFRLKIERGEWGPGGQLPVIEELQKQYGLSRATIREALQMLESDGLIERHRGKGTFVSTQLPERRSHSLPTSWAELINGLKTVKPRMLAATFETSGDELRDLLTGTPGGPYTGLQRVHSRGDEPYCLIDIHLRTDIFERDRERFLSFPIVLVLAEHHADVLGAVRQRVTFSSADERTAEAIGIALGDPIVEIVRSLADNNGVLVAQTYARYPGEFVRLDFDFSKELLPRGGAV